MTHPVFARLGRHLRVFAIAILFGLGAYAVINLLVWLGRWISPYAP